MGIQKNLMMTRRIEWIILAIIFGLFGINAAPPKPLKIAIIGAGASGLAAAKNALDFKQNIVIFEKSGFIGGIWAYTDKLEVDEYFVSTHSPMYQGLRYVQVYSKYVDNLIRLFF